MSKADETDADIVYFDLIKEYGNRTSYKREREYSGETKDDFIVNMSDYETVGERFHCVEQQVTGNCPYNVLYQFSRVSFKSLPLLICTDTAVCDGITAKAILFNAWFDVCKPSAGGQFGEQKTCFIGEMDTVGFGFGLAADCCL